MEAEATTTMTAKLPILNPGEYDLWLTRIEQYFLMTNYSLWEVLKNGNKVLNKTVRINQLKFHSYQDAKLLMEAIEKSTSNTNEADTTASGVSTAHTQGTTVNSTYVDNLSDAVICAFLASQPNSPQLAKEDLEQIDPDDLEEMDLHWEMTMLTIRDRRFMKRTCRNLYINGRRISSDKSKVKCFNCYKNGHFAKECRAPKNQDNRGREYGRKTVPVETPTENALIAQDEIGGYDWSYQAKEEIPTNYAFMAFTSSGSSSSSDSEVDFSSE
nr:hypothetical protein [Tanacetum cinerariifolium]